MFLYSYPPCLHAYCLSINRFLICFRRTRKEHWIGKERNLFRDVTFGPGLHRSLKGKLDQNNFELHLICYWTRSREDLFTKSRRLDNLLGRDILLIWIRLYHHRIWWILVGSSSGMHDQSNDGFKYFLVLLKSQYMLSHSTACLNSRPWKSNTKIREFC